MRQAMDDETLPEPLPLFPLRAVLFPGALLGLKVFEARYLDLITECLRTRSPFGVVCLKQGFEAGDLSGAVQLEDVGVLARLDDVDAEQAGILRVRCTGLSRFRLTAPPQQRDNGLWVAPSVQRLGADPPHMPGPAMLQTVQALAEAIRKLSERGAAPFTQPYRLDDAGWVANRWCELLPVPAEDRQRMMEMTDPLLRLELISDLLDMTEFGR